MEVYAEKVECKVSAKRLWQALVVDGHTFLPKAMPQAISHVTYEGPAGFQPGSFRITHMHKNYMEKVGKEIHPKHLMSHTKDKLEEVDHEAFKIKYETVEGGLLGILVKTTKHTTHIEEGAIPNTCVVHFSTEYEALSKENHPHIPLVLKRYHHGGSKQIEEYLLSHDDYKEA